MFSSDRFLVLALNRVLQFLPADLPTLDAATLASWRALAYPDLCARVLSLFISDSEIPVPELAALIYASVGRFGHAEVLYFAYF